MNGRPCSFCHRPPVGVCTAERDWLVCEVHYLPAAGNGFFPRRFGSGKVLWPEEARDIVQRMADAKQTS